MPVTLAGLCQNLTDELRPITPIPVPADAVGGVHVSELLDPTPFLDRGDLLLTTGITLPEQALPLDAYATRLRAHGVAGLALGVGPVFDAVPPALVEACDRAGLPLLSVPVHGRFQSVTREFWRQIGSGKEDDLHAAVGSAHALVRATLSDHPGAGVVRALAGAVGGWSAILDPQARVRHTHPRGSRRAEHAAREVTRMRLTGPRSAGTFPLDDDDVLVHSLERDGRCDGYLLTGRTRPLPSHARHLLLSACALLQLHTQWSSPSGALSIAAPLTFGLLARVGHVTAAADLAAHLGRPVPATVRVALISGVSTPDLERLTSPSICVPGDPAMLIVDEATAISVWSSLVSAASDGASGRGVLSAPASWSEIPRLLARVQESLTRTPAGTFRDLAGELARADVVDEARLAALADYPRADLVPTLAAYLRHRGRVDPAAAELGLHRNSLRHRLNIVRRIVGADIDDPDVASTWWLALRARGLA